MRLFRFLIQKTRKVIYRVKERERRIAKFRAQREWGERMHRLMIHIQETRGPFTTEAELRGLPPEEQRPRMPSDGTLRLMLQRVSKISFPDPIYIRVEGPSPSSAYLKGKYALL